MQRTTKIILIVSGLVVAACLVAIGIVNLLMPPVVVSTDGVSGIKDQIDWWYSMFSYAMVGIGGAIVIAALSVAIRMFAFALTPLAAGLGAWIKSLVLDITESMKPAPLALDTVLREKNGKQITLGDALQSTSKKFETQQAEIDWLKIELVAVNDRTAHIEPPPPPPPPKTAEEIAAEQAETIANLQRKLAQMQSNQAKEVES
jgi:hypothetical protein